MVWCSDYDRCSLPTSPITVALYLAHRYEEGAEANGGTITACITLMHEAAGFSTPAQTTLVGWVKKGANKCRGRRAKSEPFDLEFFGIGVH